jgi:NAD(P)H-hydrate epimerase
VSIFPAAGYDETAWVDTEAMREIDRIMVEDLGIALLQMMENAGRSLADLVVTRFDPESVVVLAGNGGNGGGGLAAARHLSNIGVSVRVVLTGSSGAMSAAPAQQLAVLGRMGVPILDHPVLDADVVVDAMVGYSLGGPLRESVAELVEAVNRAEAALVSLDVPSGLDATTGEAAGACIHADATLTLCLPKLGLRDSVHTGELYLADISVPPSVVTEVTEGPAPPFGRGRILRLALEPV